MELQLTELLNLPEVVVEWSRNLGQELILDVEIDAPFASCPHCQEVSHHLHQNHGYADLASEISRILKKGLCYFGILLIVWHNKSGRTIY
jgi:transposase